MPAHQSFGGAMFVVQCPSCGAKHTAQRPKSGETVDCPRCGQALAVPTSAAEAETIDAEPQSPDPGRTLTVGGTGSGTVADASTLQLPGYEVLEEIGREGWGLSTKPGSSTRRDWSP